MYWRFYAKICNNNSHMKLTDRLRTHLYRMGVVLSQTCGHCYDENKSSEQILATCMAQKKGKNTWMHIECYALNSVKTIGRISYKFRGEYGRSYNRSSKLLHHGKYW